MVQEIRLVRQDEGKNKGLRFEFKNPSFGFFMPKPIVEELREESRRLALPKESNVNFSVMLGREESFNYRSHHVIKIVFEKGVNKLYISNRLMDEIELAQMALDSFAAALSFKKAFETM